MPELHLAFGFYCLLIVSAELLPSGQRDDKPSSEGTEWRRELRF